MLHLYPTDDGSFTLFHEGLNEIYHSRRGALQESRHVFINAGLLYLLSQKEQINILEVGFGTGLNALLTVDFLLENPEKSVSYTGLETLEVPQELWEALSYPTQAGKPELASHFAQMHQCAWHEPIALTENFTFCKVLQSVAEFDSPACFDVVYFDAFAPKRQPEMWQPEIFAHLFAMMHEGGVLVTYCAKGQVRRDLQSVGFSVERLEGPAGKQEMLRARKGGEVEGWKGGKVKRRKG
ncbi:MAG: SAM-dependent methyltransferase [Bacteroidetes bacterium]|nr:MAG: SAM-dependent methyltransferase [Bacteroidota bacterium]